LSLFFSKKIKRKKGTKKIQEGGDVSLATQNSGDFHLKITERIRSETEVLNTMAQEKTAKVYAVQNEKGGCGKTSTAIYIRC